MHLFFTIAVFFLIFSLLILIHECGHFFAAKKAGVKVEEFGFGLPPKIFGIKKGETEYTLNLIPFGGFVRMLGEGISDKQNNSKRSFASKSLRARAFIVCAGVAMNFLLAWALITAGFVFGSSPLIVSQEDLSDAVKSQKFILEPAILKEEALKKQTYFERLHYFESESSVFDFMEKGDLILSINEKNIFSIDDLNDITKTEYSDWNIKYIDSSGNLQAKSVVAVNSSVLVSRVEPGSPADQAGLLQGDIILQFNGVKVFDADQVVNQLGKKLKTFEYKIDRSGQELKITLTPNEQGRAGIVLADLNPDFGSFEFYTAPVLHNVLHIEKTKYGWLSPILAFQELWRIGKLTAQMSVSVIAGFISFDGVPEGVSGPVGIAKMTGLTIQEGWDSIIRFIAMLSLSLGVMNILPIPALDGGRLLFIIIEAITGKKANSNLENYIHMIGFIILMSFLIYVTWNDVLSLF